MAATRGKNLVLTPKAIQWGKDRGYAELMAHLENFVAMYQNSWKTRLQSQRLNKMRKVYEDKLAKVNAELEAITNS